MIVKNSSRYRFILALFLAVVFAALTVLPVSAAGYDKALNGVESYNALFEVTQKNPKAANVVFWAIKNAYEVAEVKKLKNPAHIVIVFHGPAVQLLSTESAPFNEAEWAEVENFQERLKQMKKDGVKLEVCLYAVKMMGVDKATIIPEVDQVGNGFVSVIGYQMQGYAVVRIP